MACRLYKKNDKGIVKLKNLPPGKIGIVIDDWQDFKGLIVQRISLCTKDCFVVGSDSCINPDANLEVRVLEQGELIEVDYSE